jgi:hypothetical protein
VKELRLYFEGDDRLRQGFRKFFAEVAIAANQMGCRFTPVATYGRPVQAFRIALKSCPPDTWNVLLLDWEDEDEAAIRKRALEGCDGDSVFWMVQIMESWFLADTGALKQVFKGNLNENALKRNPHVEEIPKRDVLDCLENATGKRYHKVEHGVQLLGLMDPAKVRNAAPQCDRMFKLILAKLS